MTRWRLVLQQQTCSLTYFCSWWRAPWLKRPTINLLLSWLRDCSQYLKIKHHQASYKWMIAFGQSSTPTHHFLTPYISPNYQYEPTGGHFTYLLVQVQEPACPCWLAEDVVGMCVWQSVPGLCYCWHARCCRWPHAKHIDHLFTTSQISSTPVVSKWKNKHSIKLHQMVTAASCTPFHSITYFKSISFVFEAKIGQSALNAVFALSPTTATSALHLLPVIHIALHSTHDSTHSLRSKWVLSSFTVNLLLPLNSCSGAGVSRKRHHESRLCGRQTRKWLKKALCFSCGEERPCTYLTRD